MLTTLGGYTQVFRQIRNLLVSGGLGDIEISQPRPGPETGQKRQKVDVPDLGAVLGETPTDQMCLRAKCGPSEPCLGSRVSLGPEIWPFWGGAGGRFVGWGAVLLVRDPTDKKPFWP